MNRQSFSIEPLISLNHRRRHPFMIGGDTEGIGNMAGTIQVEVRITVIGQGEGHDVLSRR